MSLDAKSHIPASLKNEGRLSKIKCILFAKDIDKKRHVIIKARFLIPIPSSRKHFVADQLDIALHVEAILRRHRVGRQECRNNIRRMSRVKLLDDAEHFKLALGIEPVTRLYFDG